ncbi:hypothetical protein HDU86_004002 [Geranomyces michiganensis]|nr:hypothetical protein HDU86_004002 [Geranomyces michiganensis]
MPLILYNSGVNFSNILNPVTYVGSAEYQGGYMVGHELARRGAVTPVCVFRTLSRADFQDRCRGVVAAFNSFYQRNDVWNNDTTNPFNYMMGTTENYALSTLTSRFQKFLIGRPDIDAVVCLQYKVVNATYGASINIAGITPSRPAIQIGVVDYNSAMVGKVDVAVHQQNWLQGFLPPIYMFLKLMVNETVASAWVPTGPLLITNETQALAAASRALAAQTAVDPSEKRLAYINHFNGLAVSTQISKGVSDASAKWNFTLNPAWTSLAVPYTYDGYKTLVDTFLGGCPTDCPGGFLTTDPGDAYLNYLTTKAAANNVSVGVIGIRSAKSLRPGSVFYVGTNDYEIGLLAGNTMLAGGVQKPLCLSRDDLETVTASARCQGLVDAYISAGVAGVSLETSHLWVDPYNKLSGALIIKPHLLTPAPPDGFLCTNEAICEALILALADTGVVAKAAITAGMSPGIAVGMASGVISHYINTAPYSVVRPFAFDPYRQSFLLMR